MTLDPSGITTFVGIFQFVNTNGGGLLGLMIVAVVFMLSFFTLIGRYGTAESLLATTFVSFLAAVICLAMGIFPINGLIWIILLGVIAFFMQ